MAVLHAFFRAHHAHPFHSAGHTLSRIDWLAIVDLQEVIGENVPRHVHHDIRSVPHDSRHGERHMTPMRIDDALLLRQSRLRAQRAAVKRLACIVTLTSDPVFAARLA